MTRRTHKPRKSTTKPSPAVDATALRLQRLWLVWIVALLVATPLVPGGLATFQEGTGIVLVMLWLVLMVTWCTAKLLRKDAALHVSAMLCAFVVLVVLILISALVMLSRGHPRPMINTVWQWISFAIALFLCREVFRTGLQQRAVVSVMLALAVGLSSYGYYQSFYSYPRTVRQYEANPDASLAAAGVVAPRGSPQRKRFEDRMRSREPVATFTLTNSLAGFLSPWLLIAIGVAWTRSQTSQSKWRASAGFLFCALVIAGCWMLTKSRTAVLATLFGLGLLAIYSRQKGWRPDWRVVAGIVSVPILLVLFGMIVGGLDLLVLTESFKSLQFRIEYWQATASMIADYPWFGCGPGNFQQYYTAYKLPAASEEIADPHNFVLEVWATAGTPAVLALLALLLVFALQVRRALQTGAAAAPTTPTPTTSTPTTSTPTTSTPTTSTPTTPTPTTPTHATVTAVTAPASENATVSAPDDDAAAWFVYLGALIGALIAYFPCGFLVGYMPASDLLLVALPPSVLALVFCHAWVRRGRLELPIVLCAIVVALVNLLSAGGITYAGVSLTLWLLCAVALNIVEGDRAARVVLPRTMWVLVGVAWLLLVFCHQTAYDPILRGGAFLAEAKAARQFGRLRDAEAALHRAASADPYASKPWLELAAVRHEQWLRNPSPTTYKAFGEAAQQMLKRNPRSSSLHFQLGHWHLAAYRATNRIDELQAASAAYRQAERLYPNYNLGTAHRAWVEFLLGNEKDALAGAELALRLDSQNPHQEQKLAVQPIADIGPGRFPQQPPGPAKNAEQAMLFLRKQLNSAAGRDGPSRGRHD